jgi:outer membrane murein-binding lipoprotein Lpp
MPFEFLQMKFRKNPSLLSACFLAALVSSGCTVSAKTEEKSEPVSSKQEKLSVNSPQTKSSSKSARIKFVQNSPADTVRVFYKNLREKRFREAMMMTNLRVAIEGLSDAEMQDLHSDFEPLAAQVPAEIQINGEIITNNQATVNAKMPNEETGVLEDKIFRLRRENDAWTILTADEEAEKAAKKEGKNYFFVLRLDIHHGEAQAMMERIAKAQMVYALQYGGAFADMQTLISQNLLPADAQNPQSTGYHFAISLSTDKKKYSANAEPDTYGKSGKLSFLLELNEKDQKAHLKFEDNKGAPLKAKKL